MKILLGLVFGICLFSGMFLVSGANLGTFQQNTDIELIQTCNNCTYCNVSMIEYPNSTIFLSNLAMTKDETAYSYTLNASYTPVIGDYLYCFDCGNLADKETGCIDFSITESGEKVSLSNIIVTLALIFFGTLCFFIGNTFNAEKWILKSSFHLFALFMGLLAINSARIIASESSSLSTMSLSGLIVAIVIISVMILYLMILFFINMIQQLKNKRGVRWKY